MESLYIDRRDTTLSVEASRLIIHHPDMVKAQSVPLTHLRFIVISSNVSLTTNVLQAFSKANIACIILNPRKTDDMTFTMPFRHGHAERRLAQYQLHHRDDLRQKAAQQLVLFKITAQQHTLQRLLARQPQQSRALTKGIETLEQIRQSLKEQPHSIESLRGFEGAAANRYFASLTYCVAASLQFTGRNRRPPKDPINAALSLTYSLTHYESIRCLTAVGLDPLIGFYHDLSYKRESLACDMVELLRARIDYWVLKQFNQQVLRIDHFIMDESVNGGCTLSKTGRAHFYAAYEYQARHWRKLLRRIARRWLNNLRPYFVEPTADDEVYDD
ncbi:MAG: CRISPR-associated endonuclease Cas1 [Moraxellaceae bacterium]|jgi:CRISPR-associated protein Cas1|nr:CRISPR-associated endonuclease Cas1 [Moraxellaceae bacterium]